MLSYLLLAVSLASAQVCTNTVAGTLPITLYSVGTYNQTNYTHVISTTSSTQALFGTVFATTANVEYNLDGLAVSGPSADCSIDCLWSLNALTNSTSPSAVMARWGDSYPLLTNQTTWAPVYCAKTQNYCGASIPLYLYYNGKRDYYVSNDGKGPSNGTAAYSFASVNNIMPGTALCYVWPMPITTTISTTPYTGTTTKYTGPTTTYTGSTVTGSTTPYTGPTTMTTPYTGPSTTTTPYTGPTTTTTPYTGPTTTTTPYTGPSTTTTAYTGPTTTTTPYTGPSTTATIYTGSTTTTKPYTGPTTTTTPYTGPSTTKSSDSSTSSSNSSGSGWWKWVLIGVGVILIAGIIIGLLGLVTVMFINPQPVKRNVAPYAPNSNVLPPQPVHAAPTPQPLTVGPTGGYPPM